MYMYINTLKNLFKKYIFLNLLLGIRMFYFFLNFYEITYYSYHAIYDAR